MRGYFSMWLSFGLLCHLLLVFEATKCSEKETVLMPKPSSMKLPTDCLTECSTMTYARKLQLGDNHNIRITDSTEGDPGEYCWSSELKCLTGDSFTSAYVVLPVDASATGAEQLEVKTTGPSATTLHTTNNPTTIAESCGLIHEVTAHFTPPITETSFCVQVLTQEQERGTGFLLVLPFWSLFGREVQANPVNRILDRK